ncbi:hypothetical protein [Bradyrhizobium lablabi]|uniref:hypothetical protein n=1 Tax=Bradyrhizobium lablabi TaxID=722472 RepID=UPI001BACF7A5|nr:hypothetical protein [Bradyrhizobium lablabi]MBR0694820.1 hypothetical protein [Bradyrhizobium lablabi]
MSAVFFVITAIAAIWSIVRYEILHRELVGVLPPQFQDLEMSRYALSVYALDPATPLSLQAEYMKVLYVSCALPLGVSLALFASGNLALGWLCLAGFCWAGYFTFKSRNTYRENCFRVRDATEG